MRICLSLVLTCLGGLEAVTAQLQMEKRPLSNYDPGFFAASAPAIGTAAPDLEMHDLDGSVVQLSSFSGKTVVFTKAGYT